MSFIWTSSRGIVSRPDIEVFLGQQLTRQTTGKDIRTVATWGRKITQDAAELWAQKHNLPLWRLEDGFLAYASHPSLNRRALSLIVDQTGIYYDASRPCDLESLCQSLGRGEIPVDSARIQLILQKMREGSWSKYNHIPPQAGWRLPHNAGRKRILLIDQTFGDRSIHYGDANQASFARMVETALREHPGADFFAKVHPDTRLGKKSGYLRDIVPPEVRLLDEEINIVQLLQEVDEVYVVTSQVGFEALLLGKKVHCFGMPFYAGWGLTRDQIVCPRRNIPLNIDQLATAALLLYPRYVQPETGEICTLEEILQYLSRIRRDTFAQGRRYQALGFSYWKRGILQRFLQTKTDGLQFVRKPRQIKLRDRSCDTLLVWGTQFSETQEYWRNQGFSVVRVEDGFIRSVGLGADLKRPSSLVFDRSGLYYDARQASDLERILQNTRFSDQVLQEAGAIRKLIVANKISKYNVQSEQSLSPQRFPSGAILAIGQVAGDASLRQGLSLANDDAKFLRLLRRLYPSTPIVYKPHPDVISKNRINPHVAPELYDLMICDLSLSACVQQAESVHVMTSLAGFEALLLGKPVHTYGLPFYAGWGLTYDQVSCPRRTRRLQLEELIAGTLLLYPSYYNWSAQSPGTAEGIITAIRREREAGEAPLGSTRWARWWRKIQYFLESRGMIQQ